MKPKPFKSSVSNRRGPILKNARAIAQQAKAAGVAGVISGATSEAWELRDELLKGEIPAREFAARVTRASAETGALNTVKTGAALTLKEGAIALAKRSGSEGLKRFAGSNVGTVVAFGVVEQGYHTVQLARGKLDRREYAVQSSQNVGSTGGAIGGALSGAAVGSAVPVIGTVIGGIVGGIAGAYGGGHLGKSIAERLLKK